MHNQAVFQLPDNRPTHNPAEQASISQAGRLRQQTTSRHHQTSKSLLPSCHKIQQRGPHTHHLLLELSGPPARPTRVSHTNQPTSRHTENLRPKNQPKVTHNSSFRSPASSPAHCRPFPANSLASSSSAPPLGGLAGSACSWWGACSGLRHPVLLQGDRQGKGAL